MTKQEAGNFVEVVLKGLFSTWKPKDEEYSLWTERLKIFDYGKCRQAVRNWYVQQDKTMARPPIGMILSVCRGTLEMSIKSSEPVLLYTIVKERLMKHGKKFFVGTPKEVPKSSEVIEQQARRDCEKANQMYRDKHIVIQDWKNLPQFREKVPF